MELLEISALLCLILGSLTNLTAALGLFLFPDVFTRMHAAGITDALGTALILVGLMLYPGWDGAMGKLALILLFALITSPTISFILAAAALKQGITPKTSVKPAPAGEEDS